MARCTILAGGLAVMVLLGYAASASAQATPAPARMAAAKTGKERLGDKASDDQRIDNCKVAVHQRGLKPRPNSCRHDDPQAAPSD